MCMILVPLSTVKVGHVTFQVEGVTTVLEVVGEASLLGSIKASAEQLEACPALARFMRAWSHSGCLVDASGVAVIGQVDLELLMIPKFVPRKYRWL